MPTPIVTPIDTEPKVEAMERLETTGRQEPDTQLTNGLKHERTSLAPADGGNSSLRRQRSKIEGSH